MGTAETDTWYVLPRFPSPFLPCMWKVCDVAVLGAVPIRHTISQPRGCWHMSPDLIENRPARCASIDFIWNSCAFNQKKRVFHLAIPPNDQLRSTPSIHFPSCMRKNRWHVTQVLSMRPVPSSHPIANCDRTSPSMSSTRRSPGVFGACYARSMCPNFPSPELDLISLDE
jgi:hypothetical protein